MPVKMMEPYWQSLEQGLNSKSLLSQVDMRSLGTGSPRFVRTEFMFPYTCNFILFPNRFCVAMGDKQTEGM